MDIFNNDKIFGGRVVGSFSKEKEYDDNEFWRYQREQSAKFDKEVEDTIKFGKRFMVGSMIAQTAIVGAAIVGTLYVGSVILKKILD